MRLLFGQGSPTPETTTATSKVINPRNKLAVLQNEHIQYGKILTGLNKDQLALGNKPKYDTKAADIHKQRQALITKIENRQANLVTDIRSTVSGFAKQLIRPTSLKKL